MFFASNGSLQTQGRASSWQKIGASWYYYDGDGVPSIGLKKINGKTYYFDNYGIMKTGWAFLDGHWNYFTSSGDMKTGWVKDKDTWYYLDKEGVMLTGLQEINGSRYYLNASGAMQTGWKWLDNHYYYFTSSGAMKTGWQKVGYDWMCLNGSGDGSAKIGWHTVGGYWYYFDKLGLMKTGWQTISGSLYYLGGANDGIMRSGWFKEGNTWYYSNGSGAAQRGWQQIGGYWYYLESNYSLVRDTIKQIGGRSYVFNSDGVMLTKSFTYKGTKYLADESGAVINTGNTSSVIDYGIQFLGENGYRFNDWYYNGNTKYRSWAWCNTFVSYVMYNCGINFKKTAYVPNAEQWMHNNYKWVDYKDSKAGDVIVFCWSGQGHNSGSGDRDHIGFLISRNADGSFTTLEGNTSNGKVAIRTRYSKNIRNIFSPR